MTDVLLEQERQEGTSSNKGDAVVRIFLLRSKGRLLPGWRQTDQGGGRFLKVPSSGGQGRGWTGPVGGWVHRAGYRARGGQLAAERLPFPHGSIRGRSLSDLGAPGVPQRRLVGSPQLGQESLIVVSQGAVGLHVGDRPLLRLPGQPGHEERHSLGLSGEARGLEDHESVHLHQEPRQLARVSGKGLGQRGWRRCHRPGPIGGNGRDGWGDLQRPGNPSPGA